MNHPTPKTWQIDLRALALGDSDHLHRFYLTWVNEFLTRAYMAEYYGLKLESVSRFIESGRAIHESRCKNR